MIMEGTMEWGNQGRGIRGWRNGVYRWEKDNGLGARRGLDTEGVTGEGSRACSLGRLFCLLSYV